MAQYIDKAALVAEIERRLEELSQLEKSSYEIGLYDAYKIVLSFLDTLEVKEVDLDALGNLARHLIAAESHDIKPKYNFKEIELLAKIGYSK